MNYKILILGLVAAVLAVGGVGYYYFFYAPSHSASYLTRQREIFNRDLSDSKKMVMTGQSSDAIPNLEKIAQSATDNTQEALAKDNLGMAYMIAGMPEKGIALLKEVSVDDKYPTAYRSTAAQEVMEYYISGKNVDFALKNIFTGPIWGDFIKAKTVDAKALELGAINGFEWITTLGPSFAPEYTLASKYAVLAGETTDSLERSQSQTLAKQHLVKGDAAYQAALDANKIFLVDNPTQVPPYTDFRLGVGLEHKAITLSMLYEQKVPGITLANVESAFTDTLALLEKDPAIAGNITSGIYTRYHLAAFYAHISAKQYSAKILTTLAPMYNTALQNSSFFQSFLKNYGTDGIYYKTQDWNDLVLLSKSDPKFKSLLLSLGWKASDLE